MPSRYTIASDFVKPELEKSLVSAILANPELYWQVIDLLPPGSFTEIQDQFQLISEAIEQEKPLPSIELKEEPALQPLETAKELAELFQKRLLADLLESCLSNIRGKSPAKDLISQLETNLIKVQQTVQEVKTGRGISWPELFPLMLADVAAKREAVKETGVATVGLATGITRLDKLLGGFQTGVHLLAAEPGVGKTTLMLQIAQHVGESGTPVLFITFEESLIRLSLKSLCQVASLEMKAFADGYGEPAVLEKAAKAHWPKLQNLYFLEGNKQVAVTHIKAKALQLMSRKKSQKCFIILDYIQKMSASSREFTDYRHIVACLVSDLRELSMRLDSPVVAISSQNRGGQGKAQLTSLKESGELEYSADTVMFLVESLERTASPPCRAVDLIIEKNRYGDKGKIPLIFKPNVGTFLEEARV